MGLEIPQSYRVISGGLIKTPRWSAHPLKWDLVLLRPAQLRQNRNTATPRRVYSAIRKTRR